MSRRVGSPASGVTYFRKIERLQLVGAAGDRLGRQAQVARHCLHDRVALRVNGRVVQRVVAVADPEKTGGLLECLGAELRHLHQAAPGAESPVLVAEGDHVARDAGRDAGHEGQQLLGRKVEVDADVVDAALDGLVQLLAQQLLVHVVLVLPYPDRLGIDFHQLGKRILKPARDADRAAHGHVQFGELLDRGLRPPSTPTRPPR